MCSWYLILIHALICHSIINLESSFCGICLILHKLFHLNSFSVDVEQNSFEWWNQHLINFSNYSIISPKKSWLVHIIWTWVNIFYALSIWTVPGVENNFPLLKLRWYFTTISLGLTARPCYIFHIPLANTYCFVLGHIVHLSRMSWNGNK